MMPSILGSFGCSKPKGDETKQIIEDNFQSILKFLAEEDHLALKLTCRAFYYRFVAQEMWIGMKLGVAEEKLEYYDDFQFEESEPKQISKKDKNIRIHSLKKQNESKKMSREPSNIKAKGKLIHANNELLFRNTEIGFKRLLKTNAKKKNEESDFEPEGEVPTIVDVNAYLINIKDPWSINMQKAHKLVELMKKMNEFHHRTLAILKNQSKSLFSLGNKLKEVEPKFKNYQKIMAQESYVLILASIQGANQGLLIDEQLNKVCKLFWTYHRTSVAITPQFDPYIDWIGKETIKLDKSKAAASQSSVAYLENLSAIQESVDSCNQLFAQFPSLGSILCSNFINILYSYITANEATPINFEQFATNISQISWSHLVLKPFYFETLFQILNSLCSKLLKLASFCNEDLTLSMTINHLKNMKSVSQYLLNISKYFAKVRKQLEEKQKKVKDGKADSIRHFLQIYEKKEIQVLYQVKNPAKLQKSIAELKQRIAGLKNKVQAQ